MLAEDGEVLEVALDALRELVRVASLAVDHSERLFAPGPPATRARLRPEPGREPRPLGADDQDDGAGGQHDRDNAHRFIVVRGLRRGAVSSDTRDVMPREFPLTLALITLAWLTVARAVLVFAQKLPPTCRECGRKLERRYLGESVCSCGR